MKKSVPGFDPSVEGAICRFDLDFALRIGEYSEFLKSLSDLWTIAVFRFREANDLLQEGDEPVLFSSDRAVHVLNMLCAKDDILKLAVFQEPFGFANPGEIERAFVQVFGDGVYLLWRDAFDKEQFKKCLAMIETKR
jgi:hypothetical protein